MANSTQRNPLFTVEKLQKTFHSSDGQQLVVLNDVNFTMYDNEIVALLGKSGSGKSTFLRIIAGLIQPSAGRVIHSFEQNKTAGLSIAMVFQNFALLPWLTVLQNVELGLEALGVPHLERRQRALKTIDTIGLDGFESAYPKELSGGMRQRVGFARALVVNPELLLMDEPFSALDVLTAESLKNDLIDLWQAKQMRTKGILFVTHNIEEAAMMADRIIIFDSNPGRIKAELEVSLPFERDPQSTEIRNIVDELYSLMTTKARKKRADEHTNVANHKIGISHCLPQASAFEISSFVEALFSQEKIGRIDLPLLADELDLDADNLFLLTEALEILNFATLTEGNISLTPAGKNFAQADILERKKLFATQLKQGVPLANHIQQVLDKRPNHRESEEYFLNELEEFLLETQADLVLTTMIDWGRYAEIFAYDFNTGILSLENP